MARYDEIGLINLVASQQRFVPGLGVVWAGVRTGQEPPMVVDAPEFNFARAAATAAGMLIFLGVGLAASLAVAIFAGPLWGIATAVALGSGFYLVRDWQISEYRRLYNV